MHPSTGPSSPPSHVTGRNRAGSGAAGTRDAEPADMRGTIPSEKLGGRVHAPVNKAVRRDEGVGAGGLTRQRKCRTPPASTGARGRVFQRRLLHVLTAGDVSPARGRTTPRFDVPRKGRRFVLRCRPCRAPSYTAGAAVRPDRRPAAPKAWEHRSIKTYSASTALPAASSTCAISPANEPTAPTVVSAGSSGVPVRTSPAAPAETAPGPTAPSGGAAARSGPSRRPSAHGSRAATADGSRE